MAIIYSYPLNDDIKPLDELVGTTEKNINGQLKTVTRNFLLQDLTEFFIVDGGLQKTIILTTDGNSGPSTLDDITGVLNIPDYSEAIPPMPGLEQVLSVGNEAENSIVLNSPGLGSTIYGAFSTTYIDSDDRSTTLFYKDGTYSSANLEFVLPSDKVDGRYTLATIDDIPAGSPITIVNDNSLFSTGLTGTGEGSNATNSNFFGTGAGYAATDASYSNFFGINAGYQATDASSSNFFGNGAGREAINSNNSIFLGKSSGAYTSGVSYSILIGSDVGRADVEGSIGSNNIIIGTSISLPAGTTNSMNIGGILFGKNTNDVPSGVPSIIPSPTGKIGIGVVEPTNTLHIYSETEDTSGLRLERLTSASPTSTGQAIGVDASGNIVTVEGGGGGSQDLQSVLDNGSTANNTNVILSSEGGNTLTLVGGAGGTGTLLAYSTEENGTAIRAIGYDGIAINAQGGLGLALYAASIDESLTTDKNVDVANFVNNTLSDVDFLYDCSAINVNTLSADGIRVYTNSGIGTTINQGASGKGLVINSGTSSTGNPIVVNKNGVDKFTVNQAGELTATKLIKSGGTSSQILAADGEVITAGTNITITGGVISSVGGTGGGGSSVNYYLNGGTSQGTFGGATYYEFSKTAVIGTGADFSRGTNGYIASFITDVADPSLLLIPAGNWNLEFFFSSSSAGGSPSFYVELYKYDGTTFTSIASSSATPEGITNGTSIDAYFTLLAVPETVLTVNDRLAIRVFVNASSKTITLHTQNGHLCEVITTFTAGLTALNGLQAQVQNFATGTTGTDFDINSSGSTHTFNLPSASATARGVVTTTNQTFAGNKTFTETIGASNLSGTNTGDNATNTQYSGLATSKQDTLQSTVNIKSINGSSILGSGDLTISGTGISSLNGLTGATQTFSATTNTGTGIPAWTSSGTNHQLNIPIAGGATTTGLITGTSQFIAGIKTFTSNPEIPVPAGNSGPCIVLGSTGGGGATGTLSIGSTTTYPNGQEMQYVKGITSSVQTQLDGKQPTLTAGNGINIITNTISTVDTSRAAYTMLANNTNASAIPTAQVYKDIAEQTYSLSPTFTVTAPTTIVANTYKWNQVGSSVTVRVNLSYTTAGSFTTVVIPLPTDMPTPLSPTGFTAASDILYYGTGSFTTTTSTAANLARVTFLRRNAANNGYEFVMLYSTAIAARVVTLTLQYFT